MCWHFQRNYCFQLSLHPVLMNIWAVGETLYILINSFPGAFEAYYTCIIGGSFQTRILQLNVRSDFYIFLKHPRGRRDSMVACWLRGSLSAQTNISPVPQIIEGREHDRRHQLQIHLNRYRWWERGGLSAGNDQNTGCTYWPPEGEAPLIGSIFAVMGTEDIWYSFTSHWKTSWEPRQLWWKTSDINLSSKGNLCDVVLSHT